MKKTKNNKSHNRATHITKGNVLNELCFDEVELGTLKFKVELLEGIRKIVRSRKLALKSVSKPSKVITI